MTIINDIWGQIKIDGGYEKIINTKEFNEMKQKRQLGLNTSPNAIHTRYQHSLGVYYLACKLIDICKTKFKNTLTITKEDEEAIRCMALVHDIGHGCFSHVSEKFLGGTHENRTIEFLLDKYTEIHQVILKNFGEEVLQKVISLIKMKENIKDKAYSENANGLILVLAKLLSGGIDIDRIDYIFRDSFYVTGERNDFSAILDCIDLECIDDNLEIVYDENAEYLIANFFNKRFELYDSVYLEKNTIVLEEIFGKFLENITKNWCESYYNFIYDTGFNFSWNTTEVEIQNLFREHLSDRNPIIRRYANLLCNRALDEKIIIIEINDKSKYDFYCEELFRKVPELRNYPQCFLKAECKSSIYNGNKIFIRKSGLIKDISECSMILNSELKKEKYILGIDLYLLEVMLKKDKYKVEVKTVIERVKRATENEIEQEKKYIFTEENSVSPVEGFKIIREKLGLDKAKYIENMDTYFDCEDTLEKYRINVRRRISGDVEEWTVKRPLDDKTSISKRVEKNFASLKEVLNFLNVEWNIPIDHLDEKLTLKTLRAKYNLDYDNGLFEIVFDKTIPIIDNVEYSPEFMIECELKKGNSSGLFFINSLIRNFNFIKECKFSKKEIAQMKRNPKTKVEVSKESSEHYLNRIKKIFFVNPILLEQLEELNVKKEDIKRLQDKYGRLSVPIVITISGTPRAGKTTCVDNLFEFLKKCNLNTSCLEEPAELVYKTLKSKDEKNELLKDRVGFVDRQYEIGRQAVAEAIASDDIVICDRGMFDPFIWYEMYYEMGLMDEIRYNEFMKKLNSNRDFITYMYNLYCDCNISLERDYINSLSIEPRSTMTPENIGKYNRAMLRLVPDFEKNLTVSKLINTTNSDRMDASISVANEVVDNVMRLYRGK